MNSKQFTELQQVTALDIFLMEENIKNDRDVALSQDIIKFSKLRYERAERSFNDQLNY